MGDGMSLAEFNQTHLDLMRDNTTLVEDPLIVLNLDCPQTADETVRGCPVTSRMTNIILYSILS